MFDNIDELKKIQHELKKQDEDTVIALSCHILGITELSIHVDYEMLKEFEDESFDCNSSIILELNKITLEALKYDIVSAYFE